MTSPPPQDAAHATSPTRLVVVGGGISGLAAAHAAVEASRGTHLEGRLEVLVLERAARVGGKALTRERDGFRVEGGPTGFLDNEPALDRLVAAAGLEKLPADEASARRFLVRGGKLREIRPHPLKFATSGILSPGGVLRIAREAWVPRRASPEDESVWAFAQRRLGRQAADRLIAPMVLGVFAGDAKALSLRSAFPRMHELERDHGSLLRAMKALRASGRARGGPAGPGARLTSFADGLQALPLSLAERGGFAVRTDVEVGALRPDAGRWQVEVEGDAEPIPADAVALAVEPWRMAELLPEGLPASRAALAAIPCPAVHVVALGFPAEALARTPRGFGALIPRGEGYTILGVLWDTHLFPGRSPDGTLLVRAMLGGAVTPEVADAAPDELAAIARSDVKRLLGLREEPVFEEVVRWPRAIPQYTLGHADRVATIEAELDAWHGSGGPPVALAENGLHGVAFGKADARGAQVGDELVAQLCAPGS